MALQADRGAVGKLPDSPARTGLAATKSRPTARSPQWRIVLTQSPDAGWIADEPTTGQFGSGATPDAAMADLMKTLRGYAATLRSRQASLALHLREQLEWLEARVG